jgi:crotonobetaine/carnitine-CoA ligase
VSADQAGVRDVCLGDVGPLQLRRDPAVVQDDDAVGQPGDLVGLRGGDDDRAERRSSAPAPGYEATLPSWSGTANWRFCQRATSRAELAFAPVRAAQALGSLIAPRLSLWAVARRDGRGEPRRMSTGAVPAAAYVGRLGEPATLPEILELRAAATPDAPFLTFADRRLSYGDALRRARSAAAALSELGLRRGETLAVMLPNSLEFVDLWLGSALLGAVLVPVNTHLRGDGLRYILEHCDARIAVVDAELTDAYEAALPAGTGPAQRFVRGAGDAGRWAPLAPLLDGGHGDPPSVRIRPGDLASVLYTSGTTGLPKGVMTCHNAYVASAFEYAQRYVRLREDDRLYTFLPLFHINAQSLTIMPSLLSGRPCVLDSRFSASSFLDDMRRHGATVFNYIGAVLTILLKQPVRSDDADHPVRLTVGSSAPADRWREFESRFGIEIVEIYGLTETAGVALASPSDDVRVGTCGIPVSWSEVQIQRADGTEAATDEPGEFVIRSHRPDTMFRGYYKNEVATAAANAGGWFHAGDRGRRSADGYFTFIDRLKDSIRRRGENISSYEVERVVNAYESVVESAAVGVPSDLGEEEVMIIVVPRDGQVVDPQALIDFCTDRLAAFMVPRYVRTLDALPKTPTEKIQKFALRDLGTDGAWDRLATQPVRPSASRR